MLTQAPAQQEVARSVRRGAFAWIAAGAVFDIVAPVVRLLFKLALFAVVALFALVAFVGFAAWASRQPAGGPPLIESTR